MFHILIFSLRGCNVRLRMKLPPHHSVRFLLCATAMMLGTTHGLAGSQVVVLGQIPSSPTNIPSDLTNVVMIAGGTGEFMLALRSNGTVTAWSKFNSVVTNLPANLTNVIAIKGGGNFAVALKADGSVSAWGLGNSGQTNVPIGLTNVIAIATGGNHTLALRSDGTIAAWGSGAYGQTNVPSGLRNVIAIGAGPAHSFALTGDGRVLVWGGADISQSHVPEDLTNAVSLFDDQAVSLDYSLVIRADGTVSVWPQYAIPPAGLSNVITLAGGSTAIAARSDGTVVTWGSGNSPTALSNVVAVAATDGSVSALIGDGPPFLTSRLPNRIVPAGRTARIAATATGAFPLHYQWRFSGTNLPAATGAVLNLTNASPENTGLYSVAVSNLYGTIVSPDVSLEVTPFQIVDPRLFVLLGRVQFGCSVQGVPGFVYEVQASSNMLEWQAIAKVTNTSGRQEFATHADLSQQFFRLRLVP
jgi:hypothetical protein